MAEPTTLNCLADLCLRMAFGGIPISDLISNIGRLCTRFRLLAVQQLGQRRTLVLLEEPLPERYFGLHTYLENPEFIFEEMEHVLKDDGTPWITSRTDAQIEVDVIRLPVGRMFTDEHFTERIIQTLPRITHLTIVRENIPNGNAFEQLIRLLRHFTPRLISLNLRFWNEFNAQAIIANRNEMFQTLIDTINGMQSLRHLTWNVDRMFDRAADPAPRLTILSRLDTFTCYLYEHWLFASLQEHANEHVRIAYGAYIPANVLLQFNPQLASQFIIVNTTFPQIENEDVSEDDNEDAEDDENEDVFNARLLNRVEQFCNRFSALVSVTMNFNPLPIQTLARCLAQLRELVCLELSTRGFVQPEDEDTPLQINPVTSVRCLQISIETHSHRDTEQLHIEQLFPNVQVLIYAQIPDECAACQYDYSHVLAIGNRNKQIPARARIRECMLLSRRPFRACASVHTVRIIAYRDSELPDLLTTIDQL